MLPIHIKPSDNLHAVGLDLWPALPNGKFKMRTGKYSGGLLRVTWPVSSEHTFSLHLHNSSVSQAWPDLRFS